jgi:proteasome lid subunit RPN8/RPN11
MDPEIHFGDIEQAPPQTQLRPDRNRHFVVVGVYQPNETDLPIFVDLDAMREMEEHAQSDTRVELGGVLLGGQLLDEQGQPFLLVTDTLRARHYESTKGSFKFTHDTWQQITRERDQFPTELQMVGWYHTHPDWGVFLSGLDMFICENFFNKPLDVALVIDPCRQDRGFFQWTPGESRQTHRTDGFYLMASRFRAAELEDYAAYLEAKMTMTQDQRRALQSNIPSVFNVVPQASLPQTIAVLGMLSLQFCFLMLLSWRLLLPAGGGLEERSDAVAIKASIDRMAEGRQREADIDAKLQVLDMVVRQGSNAPEGVLKSLSQERALTEELRASLRGQQSLARELEGKATELAGSLADANRRHERNQSEIAELELKVVALSKRLDESRAKTTAQAAAAEAADEERSLWTTARMNSKPLGLGALFGALMIGTVIVVAQHLRKPTAEENSAHVITDE